MEPWDASRARKEFAIHFVKTAQAKFAQRNDTEKLPLLLRAGAYIANVGLDFLSTFLTPRSSQIIAESVPQGLPETGTTEYFRIKSVNRKRKLESQLGSSIIENDILQNFRKKFLRPSLDIFHAYEFQLCRISRQVESNVYDRSQGIQILAEYAATRCYAKFVQDESEDRIHQGILNPGFLDTLKSYYKGKTTDTLVVHLDDLWTEDLTTHAQQFFSQPIPVFQNSNSELLFESKEFNLLVTDIEKSLFKLTRLRRPFKSEWISFPRNSTVQNVSKIQQFDNRHYFWEDQSESTEQMYSILLPHWLSTSETVSEVSSKIPRLESSIARITEEGKENTSTIIEEVRDLKEHIPNCAFDRSAGQGSIPPSACLPEEPVTSFVGRSVIFQKISRKFDLNLRTSTHPHECVVVMAGSGGIGKTQIANKFASQWKGSKFWINCETFDCLKQNFVGLGKKYKILSEITEKEGKNISESEVVLIAQELYQFLTCDNANPLFIFDNAEQLNSFKSEQEEEREKKLEIFGVSKFLPKSNLPINPAILITSRNQDWGLLANEKLFVIPIPVLTEEESQEFLHKAFGIHCVSSQMKIKEETQQLNIILAGYPLALRLAAGFIRQECIGDYSIENMRRAINVYLDLDWSHMIKVDDPERMTDYDLILANVWEKSYKRIEETFGIGERAVEILKLMAYLETEFIFVEQFVILAKNLWTQNSSVAEKEDDLIVKVLKVLHLLEKYSMIEIHKDHHQDEIQQLNSKIWIHRLIQLWARVKADKEQKWLVKLVKVVNGSEYNLQKFEHSIVKMNEGLRRIEWGGGEEGMVEVGLKFRLLTLRDSTESSTEMLSSLYRFLWERKNEEMDEVMTAAKIMLIYEKFSNCSRSVWSFPIDSLIFSQVFHKDDEWSRGNVKEVRMSILNYLTGKVLTFHGQFVADETIFQLKNLGTSNQFDLTTLSKLVEWTIQYRGMYRESLNNWLIRSHGHVLTKDQVSGIWKSLYESRETMAEYEVWEKMEMIITFSLIFNQKKFPEAEEVLDYVEKRLRLLFEEENSHWNAPLRYLTEKMFVLLTEGGELWRDRLLRPEGLVASFIEALPVKIGQSIGNWNYLEYRELYALFATPKMCDFLMTLEMLPEFEKLLNQDSNCKDSWNLLREAGIRLDNLNDE